MKLVIKEDCYKEMFIKERFYQTFYKRNIKNLIKEEMFL